MYVYVYLEDTLFCFSLRIGFSGWGLEFNLGFV